MGADPDAQPVVAQHADPVHSGAKLGQTYPSLLGMRAEYFQIRYPGAAALRQCLDCSSRVAGIRNCGYPGGKAGPDTTPGRVQVVCCIARRFELPQVPDPRGELALRHLTLESSEFQVGVSIDQAGKNDGVIKPLVRNVVRSGDRGIGSDGLDAAGRTNQ